MGNEALDSPKSSLDVPACAVALAIGLVAGLLAIAFRTSLGLAEHGHLFLVSALARYGLLGWLCAFALAGAAGALARWLVARFAPETAGSGIPGVEARLAREPDRPMRWRRILPVKFAGGIAALATGMSLGREGPTVQLGAAAGEGLASLLGGDERRRKALVAAGAAAGLTGAFDAPIAGFLFVLEELRQEMTALTYTTSLIAALAAQLVIQVTIGPYPLFGLIHASPPLAVGLAAAAVCGIAGGLVGALYNRVILAGLDLFESWRSVPTWVHGATAGVVSIAIGFVLPGAIFGGDPVAGSLARGDVGAIVAAQTAGSPYGHLPISTPWLVLLVIAGAKLLATAVSYGSGVVGGLFAPQLVVGAAVGAALGELARPLVPDGSLTPMLAGAGAIAVFTASVRVPITGLVLLLEMTGAATQAFPWTIAASAAFIVATAVGSEPIYESLGSRAERRAPAAAADPSAS